MGMKRIRAVLRKEWAQLFKNRMVLLSLVFMPLLFTAIPLVILYTTRGAAGANLASEIPPQFARICSDELNAAECFQYYMISSFLLMFMITPLIIPVNIAAQAIVGEKNTHSLEPLLATPITTFELLAAKNLAAAVPAVLATWVGFGTFVIGAGMLATSRLIKVLLDPLWLLAVFLVGPLLAVLSVNFALIVSSRVNDPRVAEQLSAVVILPLLLLFFGQIGGLVIVNPQVVLLLAAIAAVLDAGLIYLAVQLFQREHILTRWR
jgi:ABC-2 type transport system permease protein